MRQKVPSISVDMEEVVFKALAKDPLQRFASIEAFASALEKAMTPTVHLSRPALEQAMTPTAHPSHLQTGPVSRRPPLPSHYTPLTCRRLSSPIFTRPH